MIVFSTILYIDTTLVRHNRSIPVVLDNGIKIGSCILRTNEGYVDGQFYLHEDCLDCSGFYYRFCPMQPVAFNKIRQLVIERLGVAEQGIEFLN